MAKRMFARRTIRGLPALLAVGMLAGCGTQPTFQDLPAGGVDAGTGQIVIDDIWVDAPHGLAAGADAPLRLAVANESATTDDALVGVSTPVAAHVALEQDGHAVDCLAVPAASWTDLEWRTGVELEGMRRSLIPGQWFPVTFRFARSAPVTVLVTVGPLGAPPVTSTQETLTSRTIRRTR